MTEKEKKIIFVFIKAFPLLNDLQQEKLLAFAEGMAFMSNICPNGVTKNLKRKGEKICNK